MLLHKIFMRLVGPTGLLLILVSANVASGQGSSFTYQGRLQDGGTNANGSYDFQFTLWDALSGGTQQPQPLPITVAKSVVAVNDGAFSVQLDFGANAFPGAGRFLEISVRPANNGTFTVLSPRQSISSTPYALRSLNAASADNVPVSGVPAGSGNYIQNTTAQQASSNFNISGGGVIAGNLAVGTPSANARLHVVDTTNATASTAFFRNLGSGEAVRAQTSTSTGSLGGFNYGVFGSANTGVEGVTFGLGDPTPSIAVFGHAESTSGSTYGVWGQSKSSSGIGLFGWAQSTTGNTIGVEGLSQSPSGFGVRGTGSVGVLGSSDAGTGVRGFTSSGTALHGISSTGLAGRFEGQVWVRAIGSVVDVLPVGGQNLFLGGGNLTGSELKLSNSGTAHFSIYNSGNSNLTFANTSANLSANTPGSPLMSITSSGNVGIGTTVPASKLQVNGQTRTFTLSIDQYVTGIGSIQLCTTNSGANSNLVGLCSSSLRYKTNVESFRDGLSIINRLRPISFDWKQSGEHDLGLAAEEVEQVSPLLTFRNDKGEIEGVKYQLLSGVLINAVKEQQAQIQLQQDQLQRQQDQITRHEVQAQQHRAAFASQQRQLDVLKKLVCRRHRRAALCR